MPSLIVKSSHSLQVEDAEIQLKSFAYKITTEHPEQNIKIQTFAKCVKEKYLHNYQNR